jgi:tRNA A22 N-methylase
MLRRFLWENGWYIRRETLAKDGKFVYSVMEVCFGPSEKPAPWEHYISKALLEDGSPLLKEYYDRLRQGLRLSVEGLRRSGSEEWKENEETLSQLDALEGKINEYGS